MKFRTALAIVFILAGSAHDIVAEPLEFIYEHYSSDDGLPHNSICDIHQDGRGYLWLCTWYGLSRYDGNGFVNYTMRPGDYSNLSHNRILSVNEDKEGYLWVTTYDWHLYRFDVDDEKFVAVPSELKGFTASAANVKTFMCAKDGNVWVALSGSGLLKVSPDLTYETYFSGFPVGKDITHMFEDSRGTVYVVSETGISMFAEDNVSLLARDPETFAFAESDGVLYFASPDHLLTVDMDTHGQKNINLARYGAGNATTMSLTGTDMLYVGFRDNAVGYVDKTSGNLTMYRTGMGRVRYLFPDPEGLLWIATERTGIWAFDRSHERFRHYEHPNNVMSYYVDTLAHVESHGDRLWIKMNNYGFGYYDRCCDQIVPLSNVKTQPDHRFMNGVACYDIDDSGVLWMSTVGRGLERVTVITPKVDVIVPPTRSDDEKSSSEVRAMLRDSKDNIWVATKSRELYLYSPDMSVCRRFPDSRSGDIGVVYSIFEDRDGNIWLGTKGDGVIRMTQSGEDWECKRFKADPNDRNSLSSNNVYSIAQDKDGRIWIGTYGGALSMLPTPYSDEFVTVNNNFPDYPQDIGDRVRYLHSMPDGRMLVATIGGIILFEPSETPELTIFNHITKTPGDAGSLGNNDVIHVYTDRRGNTWLCTFGGGLNRLYFENGVPRFEVVCDADGLASNIVHSVIDDPAGNLWIATEAGLSRYDAALGQVTNYSVYDGVPKTTFSEATCASMADGSVLFGTFDNVYRIDPDNFDSVVRPGRLTVTGLNVDGVRTPFKEKIVIPNDCSYFRVEFSSLDFSRGVVPGFSYMLEGYDAGWISASGNSATYSHLHPGRYLFKVRETYPEDVKNTVELTVPLIVRPSIWNAPVSIAIYVILALLLVFFLIRMVMSQFRLRSDVRIEHDLNEIKARFFTNISHELRTPLTLIMGGIDDIRKKLSADSASEYSVNMVYKNARRMMTLVNQLLDLRTLVNGKVRLKVQQLDVVKLVNDVYQDFRDMSAERQIDMRIILSVDSLMVWGDAMRLEALVYNLLSNAFKYTSDGGKIEVGVLYREGEKEFRIMVKDNGIGVPEDKREAIFEPFIKGAESAYRGMSSSGIGLSFCKEIVDAHSGSIWVESGSEAGSKFFVRLPIDRERFDAGSVQFVDEMENASQVETYGLSRYKVEATHPQDAMKVLVVEDNAELKVYIYNSLISRYEVRDASNGREAMRLMEDGWIPDMIVTDLMMPEMNGIELINNVRNDFNISHIPIVLITAKHENDTQLKAMKYGADGYIAKPFTIELLMAKIDNMLERRKNLLSSLSSAAAGGEARGKVEFVPQEIVITDRDEQLISKVMTWLEENVSDAEVTVEQLASYVGMGRTSMYNKIKGLTGKSPVELILDFRMEKATYYLKSGQYSVSETSYKVGFSDPGYFSRSFKKHFGMTPADYIKRNKSEK